MIYIKSEAGQLALKDRSLLTPRQRAAFILFDGKRSLKEVLEATAGLGINAGDLVDLVEKGLLTVTPESFEKAQAEEVAAVALAQRAPVNGQDRYRLALPLATGLTAGLGLRGFRLNLAIEAAGNVEDLIALFPKIKDAVGPEKCQALEKALFF